MEPEQKNFVRSLLPWIIAVAALLGFVLTLNPWVSLTSVTQVVRMAGWDWQQAVDGPLYWLVTLPLRCVATPSQPQALNIFSAVCAALSLAVLARSVALLPHDRTHDQRVREVNDFALMSGTWAWLPPVLAVSACGLQLTFWENATVGTGEMLDLLVFAWCVRCLLEYRLDERQRWMTGLAVVYGAGIANNWAMIAFFPGFLVALIWIRGLRFFNGRFLVRTGLAGLAGLTLCLLLPTVLSLQEGSSLGFWQMLRYALASQKQMLSGLVFNKAILFHPDHPLWVVGLFSLLPLLLVGIKWPSYFGDSSPLGIALATFAFHAMHALMLFMCVWFMFDPPLSPRALGMPASLTLYYCAALSIGYFAGYFLIVFSSVKKRHQGGYSGPLFARIARVVMCALVGLVPAGLILKNLATLRELNSPALGEFASLMTRALPAHGAILLCDDSGRFFLMQAALIREGSTTNFPLVQTAALQYSDYHSFLRRKFPDVWPKVIATNQVSGAVDSTTVLQMVVDFSTNHSIYYIHPSFGYYFEYFYLVPRGLIYEMKLYPSDSIAPPPLGEATINENQEFWKSNNLRVLSPIADQLSTDPDARKSFRATLLQQLRLKPQKPPSTMFLGTYYSRVLNYLGAELQRNNRLEEASWFFNRALELNPDNVVAKVNADFNRDFRAGRGAPALTRPVEDEFGKYRGWLQVITENGPYDEPNYCYDLGQKYMASPRPLLREAWQQFDRVRKLAPDVLAARLWLANIFGAWQMQDQVLEVIRDVRQSPLIEKLSPADEVQLTYLEAAAHFAQTNAAAAERLLEAAIRKFPADTNLLFSAAQMYLNNGRYSNAVVVTDQVLRLSPDQASALITKGLAYLQLGEYSNAIPALDQAIRIDPKNYEAVFDRAIAHLRAGNLDAAKSDYETLLAEFPSAHQVYYGLGEIAFQRKDVALATRHYQSYLQHAPTNSVEKDFVTERLKELKAAPN